MLSCQSGLKYEFSSHTLSVFHTYFNWIFSNWSMFLCINPKCASWAAQPWLKNLKACKFPHRKTTADATIHHWTMEMRHVDHKVIKKDIAGELSPNTPPNCAPPTSVCWPVSGQCGGQLSRRSKEISLSPTVSITLQETQQKVTRHQTASQKDSFLFILHYLLLSVGWTCSPP